MSENKLIIGMPAGSLANPKRGGNLISLLEDAGFNAKGYESGGPTQFMIVNYLFGWDGRPQEFGSQLGINEIDVAIGGDDWIQERVLELDLEYQTKIELEKVLSLKRGHVRLVGISNDPQKRNTRDFLKSLTEENDIITVAAEMPYLALDWIRRELKELGLLEEYQDFSVQKYKTPPKIDKGILIYETWGKTEAKVRNGGAHIALEITQSGSAIRNYGLHIMDTVVKSETGIWINPTIRENAEKRDMLDMFLLNLFGAVHAENKVMILFNVPHALEDAIEAYLVKNNLFADEPTMNPGKTFTEFSIQVDLGNKDLPLARIRYELAKIGAVNINTVPLNSSIPSLGVLG